MRADTPVELLPPQQLPIPGGEDASDCMSDDMHQTLALESCRPQNSAVSFDFTDSSPATLATATANRQKIRAYCRDSHFHCLAAAECGLYCISVYAICDYMGVVVQVSSVKPRFLSSEFSYARVIVLGTMQMFQAPRSSRHFSYEVQEPPKQMWSPQQAATLLLTQQLLNSSARWFSDGFTSVPQTAPQQSFPPSGQLSPPGHSSAVARTAAAESAGAGRMSPEMVQSVAERIALNNLQQLERAAVLQAAATLFMDDFGRLRYILFGRPDAGSLQFLGAEDEHDDHMTVIRIRLSGARVELENPFEPLNHVQQHVLLSMQRILNLA